MPIEVETQSWCTVRDVIAGATGSKAPAGNKASAGTRPPAGGNLQCQHRSNGRSQQAIGIYLASTHQGLAPFPAAALLVCASVLAAAEAPGQPSPSQSSASQLSLDKKQLLSDVGRFSYPGCNDPAGQKALRALPAHRFVATGGTPALFLCRTAALRLLFVGTRQAYDNYNKM